MSKNTPQNHQNNLPTSIQNTEVETEMVKDALIIELHQYFNHENDQILIENHSAGHRNHQKDAGGHYYIEIISEQFTGKTIIARQRLVYQLLKSWMQGRIHSLELSLKTHDEHFGGSI
jgi:BolA family transcriptional regulator, general stress-responsive regulator